jgi:hypothetical protein
MDVNLALMAGTDIPIPELQLTLHQPKLKEIAYIGEMDFFTGVQCLCLHKSMFIKDKDGLEDVTNFQIFMTVMMDKTTVEKKIAATQVLQLVFPGYNVLFTPMSLILQNGEMSATIDASNFEFLQQTLRLVFCAKDGPMDQQAFNPANDKAREIAEKLMRGRQRVAAQKGGQNTSVFSRYLSVLTIGIASMSLLDLVELTMFQLYDLIERYILHMNWDIDVRTRLAGGKPDSQPENWMKDIH